MFQIIGATAEFERALIQERVKAGLRNARAKENVLAVHGALWMPPGLAARLSKGVPCIPNAGSWTSLDGSTTLLRGIRLARLIKMGWTPVYACWCHSTWSSGRTA
jgi:resolvase-like protein